ncbi:N-acetyltransferase [Aquihabitans sp. G128]|uniref:GNAT family N-acetyltransferase n=1 Tax=Aquihabitans sp. G128 TaxID=2849779 RepID=UPI001C21295D|nr:N-acetyltransferase [Aquihabitans sp. G128]QXC60016.1 N-acetyltransferase [Aquihabitans sp. G128]
MTGSDRTPVRPLPPGVVLRTERPTDVDGISAVVEAAFASAPHAALVAAIRASPAFEPELSVVAVDGAEVVGHVMISGVGLVGDDGVTRTVPSLSPLSVRPDHQAVGIGSALVREVLARAGAAGHALVVLEGDPGYYSRLGFEASGPHGIAIDLPSWAPPEAAQVAVLATPDPRLRGRIAYPPAFALVEE